MGLRCSRFVCRRSPEAEQDEFGDSLEMPPGSDSDSEFAPAGAAKTERWMSRAQAARAIGLQKTARPPEVGLRRQAKRFKPAGAHIGFELALSSTAAVCGCGACGAPLCRSSDVVQAKQARGPVPVVSWDDAPHALLVAQSSHRSRPAEPGAGCCLEGPEKVLPSTSPDWTYLVRYMACPQCKIFLGRNLAHAGLSG